MKRTGWVLVAALVAALGTAMGVGTAAEAQDAGRTLQFSLDRGGPPLVQYTIAVDERGAGAYVPHLDGHLVAGGAGVGASAGAGASAGVAPEARPLRLSPAVVKKMFAAVPVVEGGRCETHNKSLAKTGVKVLRYQGAGREAQCTYNYSDEDRVNEATTAFEGVAETLRIGDRLAAKLRFDRLGLDTELEGLQTAVTEGRALEVGNIAPVLEHILADERVMDRVRRRVERLLQGVPEGQSAAAGTDPSVR